MAKIIEDYINQSVERNPDEFQLYLYGYIAADLKLPVDDVRRIMSHLSLSNGIRIKKTPIEF